MPWTVVYALETPVEREDPPLAGVDDRDGFAHAFPDGLPWREEGRALQSPRGDGPPARWRRPGRRRPAAPRLIQPDPHRAVDHIVHSPYWLEPEILRGVVAREVPTAQLAVEGETWKGPTDAAYTGALILADIARDVRDDVGVTARHAAGGPVDLASLGASDVVDDYAVIAALGPGGQDGALEVLVHVADPDEPAAHAQEWGSRPFVTYEVRWLCAEPDAQERERRRPDERYVAVRAAGRARRRRGDPCRRRGDERHRHGRGRVLARPLPALRRRPRRSGPVPNGRTAPCRTSPRGGPGRRTGDGPTPSRTLSSW